MARDAPTPAQAGPFRVGRWRADPATDTLVLDAREVKLEPRTMRLLVALAERSGEVCSSDDLLDKVWPGVIVTSQSLYQAVGELRATLKADAGTLGAAWNALACCEYRAAQYDWHDGDRDGLFARAVAHAERATALAPSDPDAHYTLGLILFTTGESARAEASLRHCVQLSASYAPAYGLLALVSNAAGRPQQAFELCDRALALSPREPLRAIWHWGAACAASMLGRDEESLVQAARGIAANPASPQCHVGAAVAAWRLGRKDEAARCVAVLRGTAFGTVTRLRERVPSMRVEPWASAFIADLRAAGLPER